jgi:hypothetical protein
MNSTSSAILGGGCRYCGPNTFHSGICPRVEEIEYHNDGTVRRVKLRESLPILVPTPPASLG